MCYGPRKPGEPLRESRCLSLKPYHDKILIKIHACGVCRTDLHIVDGELADPKLPLIPGPRNSGHRNWPWKTCQELRLGDEVGVPWLGFTDGTALIVEVAERTCVNMPCSPATRSMGVTQSTQWPITGTVSIFLMA